MALNTYDALLVLESPYMQTRIAAEVAYYATYLLGLGGGATTNQTAWATAAIRTPHAVAAQVANYLLNESTYTASGSAVSDSDLRTLVQTKIEAFLVPGA